MAKYSTQSETIKIREAYDNIPSQLAKTNTKFIYNKIKSGARANAYEIALDWLKEQV